MKLNRPPLAMALLSAALIAPAQTALHPEIDAFRSGDKAYVVAPPRPVAAFDYVVEVQPSFDGAEWMLVQHRSRRAQDGAAHISEADYMRPTETSLYHPGRNMVRPLPSTLPPGQLFLDSGVGDVVILSVKPSEANSPPTSRKFALDVPSGRMMELSDEKHVLVVNNNWFLTQRQGQLALVNWNGDRRPIPMDQTPSHIRSIGEPGRFVVGTIDANRRTNWHLVDINSGRIEPADNDTVIKAHDLMGNPPGLMILPEPDRPESHTAWFANSEGKDFLDFASPTIVWGLPDGRLPHELDSRAVLAGDLDKFKYGVPAGYSPGVGRNLGAAWYVRDRMMFVRQVEEMSLADYAKYIARFAQNRAMFMAKMVGVSLNIATSENDGRLPENAGWRDSVKRLIPDRALLSRVTYLGDGQRMSELQDLQGVMGFIDTPYGRANISYDSSVRWVPKAAP